MKQLVRSYLVRSFGPIVAGLVLAGCLTTATTEKTKSMGEGTLEAQDALEECSNVDCSNCVLHARCLQSALPHHLLNCEDKQAIINSSVPAVGEVAIMNVGPDCHVGYVEWVDGSGSSAVIYLDEANYHPGMCGKRHGTKGELKIVGYFRP